MDEYWEKQKCYHILTIITTFFTIAFISSILSKIDTLQKKQIP